MVEGNLYVYMIWCAVSCDFCFVLF